MKAMSIVGIILIAAGIGSLAYFASPMRLMLQETVICGIALVYLGTPKTHSGG